MKKIWKYIHEIFVQDGTLEEDIQVYDCINHFNHSLLEEHLLDDIEVEVLKQHPKFVMQILTIQISRIFHRQPR